MVSSSKETSKETSLWRRANARNVSFILITVANLHFQLSWYNQIIIEPWLRQDKNLLRRLKVDKGHRLEFVAGYENGVIWETNGTLWFGLFKNSVSSSVVRKKITCLSGHVMKVKNPSYSVKLKFELSWAWKGFMVAPRQIQKTANTPPSKNVWKRVPHLMHRHRTPRKEYNDKISYIYILYIYLNSPKYITHCNLYL